MNEESFNGTPLNTYDGKEYIYLQKIFKLVFIQQRLDGICLQSLTNLTIEITMKCLGQIFKFG